MSRRSCRLSTRTLIWRVSISWGYALHKCRLGQWQRARPSERVILQLRAVLRGISPRIWRRLLVPSDTSIAQLHEVLQVAFGWDDMYLHRFEIRGREYGLSREGGMFFDTDTRKARIGDLKLAPGAQWNRKPG